MSILPLADFWQPLAQAWQDDLGWQVPWHFGDWQREYKAALSCAAVLDISHRTTLLLTGRDRTPFLHNFCTNDIVRLRVGSGCEAFLTTAQAKVLAWFHAFVEEQAIVLDADPGRAPVILQHLSRYLISEDVAFEDLTGRVAVLHVSGPIAADKLAKILPGANWPSEEHGHVALLKDGHLIRVRRLSRWGQPGWDLVTDPMTARRCVQEMLQEGVAPIGYAAAEVLRIEAGWPVFGRDLDETHLPQEIGRDAQAISFTKGCYLGQETVARIRAYGHVNRQLCGLRLSTSEVLASGTRLLPTGSMSASAGQPQEIGRITSCVYSPRCRGVIALAWLRRGYWQPGTTVLAETPTGRVGATVSSLPFVAATPSSPS
ncbi:Aminomethyltransferase [bacterium HR36]|nr:Aminomethyltransferase [bacterium HR36]